MPKNNFKLDKETLIKHRFWFLLGLLLPLVLITLILVWTSVASATAGAKKKVTDIQSSLDAIKNPPGPTWVRELGPREKRGQKKKKQIWEHAWKSQESLFNFPPKLARLQSQPFGTAISLEIRDAFQNNTDILNEQLDTVSKIVDPIDKNGHGAVQYMDGDWRNVIGVEPTWQDRPGSDEIWYALEDVWLKAGMLDIIKDCDDSVADFRNKEAEDIARLDAELNAKKAEVEGINKQVKATDADAKLGVDQKQALLKQLPLLEKQVKDLEAQLAPLRKRHELKPGEVDRQTFANGTWQLELVLANNPKDSSLLLTGQLTNRSSRRQILGLYFDVTLRDNNTPVRILADGDPIGPRGVVPIKALSTIRSGDAITGVRQIFDWRTVPVKRIDKIVLIRTSSSRTVVSGLKPYPFPNKKDDNSSSPGQGLNIAGPTSGQNSAMQAAMKTAMESRKKMGGSGFGNPSGGNSTAGGGQGGLLVDRYSDIGEAVRRLPVVLKVVIDQAYLQDLLTATANSKLRIQITQVEWKHFPRSESIEPPRQEDETGDNPPVTSAKRGLGGKQPSLPMPGSIPGMGNPTLANPGNGAASSGPDEMSANLIEVSVYGIASIYERYAPKADQ